MVEGSFDSAFDGCKGVFHTASPVIFKSNDPQVDILDPAVKGTSNVLKSCKKFASIRRVIVTSSMCTMLHNFRKLAPDVVVDESWYADIEYCNINGSDLMWYIRSKIIAEQSAWEFAKENKMDLVIMNPGMVIGPMLQPTLNESVAVVLNLINGSSDTYPNSACPWVDVKDVAEAHIYAFEIPSAEGRYILAESVLHYSDVLKILHELYPTIKLPNKPVDFNRKTSYQVSQSKAKSLGIEYIPFKESLKNTVENLKEMKFV